MRGLSFLALAALLIAAPILAIAKGAGAQAPGADLAQANALLQAGEADKALALLEPVVQQDANNAEAHNLECRVWLTVGRFDDAVKECEKVVKLQPEISMNHLWLGRALGEKADKASFVSAYSLAKRVRTEFEEAIRLDGRNAEALESMGEFDCDAPGVVGGGLDKAEAVAAQLEKVDVPRAHELRAEIAEQRKDYDAAEREYKEAIRTGTHPAGQWMTLGSYYLRRERWSDMTAAVRSGATAAQRDKHAAVPLFDGASTLIRANRELPLAAKMLEDYLASSEKSEEAPAFVAYSRLAKVKEQLGDKEAANRDRAAAMALAHEYKPGQISRH
jgi:tetratricopeptide (TPR) repeat protein